MFWTESLLVGRGVKIQVLVRTMSVGPGHKQIMNSLVSHLFNTLWRRVLVMGRVCDHLLIVFPPVPPSDNKFGQSLLRFYLQ
jgi:hypothetical protein